MPGTRKRTWFALLLLLSFWTMASGIQSTPPPWGRECSVPTDCEDGNPCTDDGCLDGRCVRVNNSNPCDDANACTTGDVCSEGSCVGASPILCDDGEPCTTDTCDPAAGCVYVSIPYCQSARTVPVLNLLLLSD